MILCSMRFDAVAVRISSWIRIFSPMISAVLVMFRISSPPLFLAATINPARDLGPRLAHAVLPIKGKGDSNFSYGLVVPIVGPIIGAIVAVLLYGAIPW